MPDPLAGLLSPWGRSELSRLERAKGSLIGTRRRFATLDGWVSPAWGRRCLEGLDDGFADCLARVDRPVPPSTISSMRKNYSEQLPKTMSVMSSILDRPRSKAWRAAHRLGVIEVLESPLLRRVAETVTGLSLDDRPGMQILRYGPGDYAGPHNDHHPECAGLRDGFVDVHLSVSTGMAHQWLVYERDGHFSQTVSLASSPMLSVYLLPFWHYTTPLVAKPRAGEEARRWVLLASYAIA